MQIKYVCPYWGQKEISATDFIDKVITSGYDGVEIDMPAGNFEKEFLSRVSQIKKEKDFVFIAQQWLSPINESFDEYRERFTTRLEYLVTIQPDLINSH